MTEAEYERALNADFERNLRQRRFTPIKGPQFDPADVPIIEGSPAGQLMYDPNLSGREDAMLLAQRGVSNVIPRYNPLSILQRGTDTVPAMLTPHEAVLNPPAADIIGRNRIRAANALGNRMAFHRTNLVSRVMRPGGYQEGNEDVQGPFGPRVPGQERNQAIAAELRAAAEERYRPETVDEQGKAPSGLTPADMDAIYRINQRGAELARARAMNEMISPVAGYQYGTSDVEYYNPYQRAIIARINSGQTDFTFGPGSPHPTREDLGTYVGGPHAPAGGFQQHGGVALAPKEYYAFTPDQRRKLGIMDIAPANQEGKIERWYGDPTAWSGGPLSATSLMQQPTTVPLRPPVSSPATSPYMVGSGQQVLPTPTGLPGAGTNVYASYPIAKPDTSELAGNMLLDVSGAIGSSILKAGAAAQNRAQGGMASARANVPLSDPLLNQLAADPLAFLRNQNAPGGAFGNYYGG